MTRTRTERRPVADLVPADYNPRSISPEALAGLEASIRRWGLVQPIIVNERTGNVVGGHQRLKVLEAEGVEETDVVVVDLDAAEEKALNVALNAPQIAGEFTDDLGPLLDEVEAELPDLYAAVRLDALRLDEGLEPEEDAAGPAFPAVVPIGAEDFFAVPDDVHARIDDADVIVVQYSGGKDSTGALLWARQMYPDKRCVACFVDPGVEFPGIGAYVAESAATVGAEFVVNKPAKEWWAWLAKEGRWPSIIYRTCAHKFIHAPWARYVKETFDPDRTVVLTGSRGAEAVMGSKKTQTSMVSSLGDKWYHFAPCFHAGKDVLESILAASAVEPWEGYARGFVRTACWCCPGQCGAQALALQTHYPGLAEEIRTWEKRIGPMRPENTPVLGYDDILGAGQRAAEKAATRR